MAALAKYAIEVSAERFGRPWVAPEPDVFVGPDPHRERSMGRECAVHGAVGVGQVPFVRPGITAHPDHPGRVAGEAPRQIRRSLMLGVRQRRIEAVEQGSVW